MENRDKENKKDRNVEQKSPYQELYGKKHGDEAQGSGEEKENDSAGAFGSAAQPPGPESGAPARRKERRYSQDGSDSDGENSKAD